MCLPKRHRGRERTLRSGVWSCCNFSVISPSHRDFGHAAHTPGMFFKSSGWDPKSGQPRVSSILSSFLYLRSSVHTGLEQSTYFQAWKNLKREKHGSLFLPFFIPSPFFSKPAGLQYFENSKMSFYLKVNGYIELVSTLSKRKACQATASWQNFPEPSMRVT